MDLIPLTSMFTTVGLVLSAGTKITREILNKVSNNTGFNWLGGRHPMRESFGIAEVILASRELTDDQINTLDNTDIPYSVVDSMTGLVPPVDAEVIIPKRLEGVRQFSTKDSYQVFLTMITGIRPRYLINQGDENFNRLFAINEGYFNLYIVSVVSQDFDRFVIRFDMPQPQIIGNGIVNYKIAWFAKGW